MRIRKLDTPVGGSVNALLVAGSSQPGVDQYLIADAGIAPDVVDDDLIDVPRSRLRRPCCGPLDAVRPTTANPAARSPRRAFPVDR